MEQEPQNERKWMAIIIEGILNISFWMMYCATVYRKNTRNGRIRQHGRQRTSNFCFTIMAQEQKIESKLMSHIP